MPSARRWRPLVLAAAVWLLCFWYLMGDGAPPPPGEPPFPPEGPPKRPPPGHHVPDDREPVHWSKLPERYPVKTYITLPTGTPAVAIPAIQKSPPPEESQEARQVRLQRLAAVKDSFLHSWDGYKKYAWMHDEVAPLTRRAKDPFGGWAATLVDALDSLWIMGLEDEFRLAVQAVERIDFTTTRAQSVNVFETTIRYLGGLLAAYELSGRQHPSLLAKATEVAELLMCAFDTPNRMPITRWDWRSYVGGVAQTPPRSVLVAELGSLSLEFTKLAQLTGEARYYDAVQRIADEFEKSQDKTKLPGMWPIVVDGAKPSFSGDNAFTLGGMSDSLYEYLPKQYLILGGLLSQPRRLYEGFIEVAKKHLFRRALNPDNIPLIISGDARVTTRDGDATVVMTPRGQHLTCFAGGMVGLASRAFDRPDDMEVAAQLTDACVWAYNSTATGIAPEIFGFVACGGVEEEQLGDKCAYSKEKWRGGISNFWRLSGSPPPEERIDSIISARRLTPGFVDVSDKKYILRPEAIESVFIMYRLTGDPAWMEKAWAMFTSIEKYTRSAVAAASLDDVTVATPKQVDSMESFWLAETLKYFYLIYADFDLVDLDKWVLNTEAHPLRRPDV
ncbi:alpha-1,2-Mannosidase [Pleurostoma richardsiae]|uniref:alpha-1,2-Mannosidase n=1 Tax=Pleurostoma richardsiae TaxID=41990 RepID=A0AA38RMZ2_9PEZI|nr:alpha-1,2-Mannosidase [Pleurostoma richardsiae]